MEAWLPEKFLKKMSRLLGGEFPSFLESYERVRASGLRVNPLKADENSFLKGAPWELTRIPWAKGGYRYGIDERPGRHPWHEAGAYYIQEPSAMVAAELLMPEPGEKVLDLCAAPGGKTTQIAGRMKGTGLLVGNEIHPARAKTLSQNVERLGIANAVVTNEKPEALAGRFQCYFDRILVDAPCSGEGMFRKDENARLEWSQDRVLRCAARQDEILDQAAVMLRGGGRLVYSTCTFSPEENEGTVQRFLERHPEFSVVPAPKLDGLSEGRPDWTDRGTLALAGTVRIWPQRTEGEGHYAAVLEKADGPPSVEKKREGGWKDKTRLEILKDFLVQELNVGEDFCPASELVLFGEQLYRLPAEMISCDGLRILRPGLHLGAFRKARFEPSHALALHLKPEQARRVCDLNGGEVDIQKYLEGQALMAEEKDSGWVLMAVDGYSVGWAKRANGTLKNHYPKGLRVRR